MYERVYETQVLKTNSNKQHTEHFLNLNYDDDDDDDKVIGKARRKRVLGLTNCLKLAR